MKFSLFKKAVAANSDVGMPGPGHPIAQSPVKKDVKESGLTPKQIAEGNKKALDFVRMLEVEGKEIRKKQISTMIKVGPLSVRLAECDATLLTPVEVSEDPKWNCVLSSADLAALKRWTGTYNSYPDLFRKLDLAYEALMESKNPIGG